MFPWAALTRIMISHIRLVKRRSKVTKRQKNLLTADI
jgi:hypothetical protein